ncbi:hybrid sensor histidine kinase/response regulator [Thiolinea disciformis]|uniref:hybrid sensor histidine kinase/response regulator n=1 Tax=Thiolinea disciformis TaxID=125614 RepID=UPI0003801752|nr:response regulator [Thiolinea disciformis]
MNASLNHPSQPSLLAAELEDLALQIAMLDPNEPWPVAQQAIQQIYQNLTLTAQHFDLAALQQVIEWVQQALVSETAPDLFQQASFATWLEVAALLLREPDESAHLSLLMNELTDDNWPQPLDPNSLQQLLVELRSLALATALESEPETATPVEPTLVAPALSFAPDVHPDIIAAYREEAPNQVTEAARLIRLLAIGAGTREQQRHAARLVHTLKGSSGVVGVTPIVSFTHDLENLLDLPLQQLPEGLGTTLEAAADCLESLFDHLFRQESLPSEYATIHAQIAAWSQRLAESGEETELASNKQLAAEALAQLMANPPEPPSEPNERLNAPALVLSEERIQGLLNLAAELITSQSQMAEALDTTNTLLRQLQRQEDFLRERLEELDELIQHQAHKAPHTPNTAGSPFDALELEAYGELHSTSNLLAESAADNRELVLNVQQSLRQLTELQQQQQRIQGQLNDAILATRLMPVSSLTPRLERIVRETCRQTGKKAELEIMGQNLWVDNDLLKGLTEPLLHLLRNAVDHGIETPEQRRALGKPELGKIRLSISQQTNYVSLVLEDDGAGMDLARIRERALERGLLRSDEAVSDEKLLRLILQPRFSTRDTVSEVSGRGVGMDVVQAHIQRLRGHLHLQTQLGQGSQIRIELPQQLISTHALVVRAGGHLVAIPADTIEQIIYVPAPENIQDENGWRIENARYQRPVTQLAALLHWPAAKNPDLEQAQTLMVVRSPNQQHILYAEEILPSRDMAVKTLDPWLHHVPYIQGASILANGIAVPVIDMLRLLQDYEAGLVSLDYASEEQIARREANRTAVLVVDDSLSNRQALRLMLESMNHEVYTAMDGFEALQQLNTQAIDVVLTDLEMPRMNGLELAEAIRLWPEQKHLPIVMLTSRSTRKHRDQAAKAGVDAYLTKPVQAAQLQEQLAQWLSTTASL